MQYRVMLFSPDTNTQPFPFVIPVACITQARVTIPEGVQPGESFQVLLQQI